MSDLVGTTGGGLSIEPSPRTASYLRNSIALNGFAQRTRVVEAAVSDRVAAAARFYTPPNEPKNACLVPASFHGEPGDVFQDVPVTTIDTLVGQDHIDFIKMDAEGAEYGIFQGMSGLIARCKPRMIIEFNAARGAAREFLDAMTRQYGALRYLETDGVLYDASEADLMRDNGGQDWLLFLEDRETTGLLRFDR